MNEDNGSKTSAPPYLSFTTFRNFLDGMKEGIIPSRIDKTMMAGQSGSTQSYLLSALKFFDLINEEGTPTAILESLVKSDSTDWAKTWKPILEKHYKPILGDLDLSRSTVGQLHEKFSDLGLTGETVRKCHSFFAAAAESAGIALSPHLKPNTRSSSGPRKARKVRNGTKEKPEEEIEDISIPPLEGHSQAILPLTKDGTRLVKLEAPATVTAAELKRIQAWLSFQLIVEEE